MLLLHGAGERGRIMRNNSHGVPNFLHCREQEKFPHDRSLSQCPEESFWAVTKIDRTTTPFKIEFDYTPNQTGH